MKRVVIALSVLLTLLEGGIYEEGEKIYFQKGCNSCHGPSGEGLHEFPPLANLKYDDLMKKLNAYRADTIKTPTASIMTGYAKALHKKELEKVVYFLSNFVSKEASERYDIEFQTWGDGGS